MQEGTKFVPSSNPHVIGGGGGASVPEEKSGQSKIMRIFDTYHFEKSLIRPQDIITAGVKDAVLEDLSPHVAVPIAKALKDVCQHIYQSKRQQ